MTTGIAFAAIYRSKYGDTVEAIDPRREAYKQAHYILNVLGRHYRLTAHEDGAFTITGDGLASLTFVPDTSGVPITDTSTNDEVKRMSQDRPSNPSG